MKRSAILVAAVVAALLTIPPRPFNTGIKGLVLSIPRICRIL